MKAPSPTGLRALRLLAFPQAQSSHRIPQCQRRTYAAPAPPPPRTFKSPTPPKDPKYLDAAQPENISPTPPTPVRPQTPPPPTFRPNPSGPSLRKRRDDDEDFTPLPLSRPIGVPIPPESNDNMGLDTRTLKQRRDDFHDYEKHLARRAKMTKQIATPYFRDWSNMRFHKGKVFIAPQRLFRADVALWFPNFFGRRLTRDDEPRDYADGFRGLGRGTTEVLRGGGRVSVVSIVGNEWAERQVRTFLGKEENPELARVMEEEGDVVKRVEVNWEENWIKWWILKWFAVPGLRRRRSVEEQKRYFLVRRGVSGTMKEALGILNEKGGYVYLVDGECRIRWAGSAEATEEEKRSLAEGVKRLVKEARTPRAARIDVTAQKQELEAAVMNLTDEPKQAAVSA